MIKTPTPKPRTTLNRAIRKHLDHFQSKPELTPADKRDLDLALYRLLAVARTHAIPLSL